mmetsp:Transcript_68902/g.151897  ORF Transcript_68902/g.151897 Transcript_68902/m.151897 type:complete len:221 (+) Transcript_68902:2120-2782(+)
MGGALLTLLHFVLLSSTFLLIFGLVLGLFGLSDFGLLFTLRQLFGRDEPSQHLPLSGQIFVTILAAALVAVVEGGFRVAVRRIAATSVRRAVRRITVGVTTGVTTGAAGVTLRAPGGGILGTSCLAGLAGRVCGFLFRLEILGVGTQLRQVVGVELVALLHLGAKGVEGLRFVLWQLVALGLLLLDFGVSFLNVVFQCANGFHKLLRRTTIRFHLGAELF